MNAVAVQPPLYVGVDVGGTNIKAGVVDDRGVSLSKVSVPTEAIRGSEIGLANIYRAVELAAREAGVTMADIRAIGVAAPGTMDIPKGMLLEPPNLPGWNYLPIRQMVSDHFGLPTAFQNDANAAAYGEFWVGAGRNTHSLVFWTLGTGVGCGIIIGDLVIEGEHSHGAECGHIIVQMEGGRKSPADQFGTLEAYCGAKGVVSRCEEELRSGRASSLQKVRAAGEAITPLLIAQAAEQGDALADEVVMQTARYMGVGTVSLMHTIDPDAVLFGGAMTFGRNETELGRRFLQEVRDEVRRRAFPFPYSQTKIDYASLGENAGYVGAAGCARLKYGAANR